MSKETASKKINAIVRQMRRTWDNRDLRELFEEAKTLYFEWFPFEAMTRPSWWVERTYNDLVKRNRKQGQVTVNLFGCNISIATA